MPPVFFVARKAILQMKRCLFFCVRILCVFLYACLLETIRSRIFSSGKFQEEEANNARDSELSLAKAACSSNDSMNESSGSSGSSVGMSRADSAG